MQFQKPVCPVSRASHPLWGLGACWGAGAAPSLRITMEGRPADRKPDQPQRRGRWVTWAWATVIAPVTQHDTQFFKGRDENSAENCSGNGPAVKPRGRASPWAVGGGGRGEPGVGGAPHASSWALGDQALGAVTAGDSAPLALRH